MYKLKKTMEIAIAHRLTLSYQSKCENTHGHNLIITVFCKSKELNENDMIIDFSEIKRIVMRFDHKNLNEECYFNPTAENLAKFLCEKIPKCYKVKIKESKGNEVSYEV